MEAKFLVGSKYEWFHGTVDKAWVDKDTQKQQILVSFDDEEGPYVFSDPEPEYLRPLPQENDACTNSHTQAETQDLTAQPKQCDGCGTWSDDPMNELERCSACQQAFYCDEVNVHTNTCTYTRARKHLCL